jgi:hypothetical protein
VIHISRMVKWAMMCCRARNPTLQNKRAHALSVLPNEQECARAYQLSFVLGCSGLANVQRVEPYIPFAQLEPGSLEALQIEAAQYESLSSCSTLVCPCDGCNVVVVLVLVVVSDVSMSFKVMSI